MPVANVRVGRAVLAACLGSVVGAGCANGGSSGAHTGAAIPSTVQQSVAGGHPSVGGRERSSTRRTLNVPNCKGTGTDSFVGGTDGNTARGEDSFVGAGSQNQACDDWSIVVGGYENAVSGTEGDNNLDGFIGGGESNRITGADTDSAIVAGESNTVSNAESAIVGGQNNSLSAEWSLIGGGQNNTVTAAATYGMLAGGLNNTVSGEGAYVAAGGYNTASGEGSVVDGGFNSTASGTFATIPGGYANSAAGVYSFAAGARASAAQNGTFVWSDGSDGDAVLTSSRAYQFLARASGGFTLYTNAASTVGAQLAAGSGTWASLSDRNAKTNIVPLDGAAVLDKVASLPISRWSYKSEHGVRHVGPMAQDFYAAFKVGEDDRHITAIDEDGVALAAIKALHQDNATLHARIAVLDAENEHLRSRLGAVTSSQASMQVQLRHLTAKVEALTK